MDQQETLLLTFKPEQANVSFMLTQWQGNGTASVILTIYDGETAIHVFAIDVAKPSGDAQIVVKQTSDLALVNTYIFDGATSTYTLYVGSEFNQVGISYDHAAAGNTTFTVNDITYGAGTTIPSTDLLFDVTAVDNDGDTSTTGLQIDLLGGTNVASAPTLDNDSGDQLVGGTSSDILIDSFGATSADSSFTVVSPPRPSTGGYGTFAMTVAGLWTYMLEHAHATVQALDGTMQLETVVIAGASDAAITSTITAGSVIEAGGTPVATGTLSDLDVNKAANPPSVDGTPQDEKIAGGCDDTPSVHARTQGPANDTANGQGENNDGIVAIHGGSASHIINNANDTVFGGYGGDRLTRSNGDDSIYQTAADSNSAKFETILDFAAGLGRTNLAAFGALAFMALSPTSTSVPPHTLAWIYDSAANRTIVYVNPTDQTLHIGDSDLLEIHLEGVTSVQAPDFVHEAAAVTAAATLETIDPALAMIVAGDGSVLSVSSDVSIDVTDSEGTHAANGIWASTADEGLNFHFARERIDSTESARLSNLDRARAYEAADGDGDSVTAHVGISVEIHAHATAQTTPSEDHFAFAQGPVHANSNAMAIADATDMHPGATIDHGGFMVANATAGAQHVGAGKTQGDNASQSQQELRPASEHATAPAQSHAKQAPAGEAVGHAEKADPPGLGDSFKFAKFTDKMASQLKDYMLTEQVRVATLPVVRIISTGSTHRLHKRLWA